MSDIFEGAKEIRPNRVTFSKLGDYIIGFYWGSKEVPGEKGPIKLYELRGITGEYHSSDNVIDPNGNRVIKISELPTQVEEGSYYTVFGGKDQVDSLFKKAKLGQKVGIRFEAAKPSKKQGYAAFKTFKTVMWDEIDPEFSELGLTSID